MPDQNNPQREAHRIHDIILQKEDALLAKQHKLGLVGVQEELQKKTRQLKSLGKPMARILQLKSAINEAHQNIKEAKRTHKMVNVDGTQGLTAAEVQAIKNQENQKIDKFRLEIHNLERSIKRTDKKKAGTLEREIEALKERSEPIRKDLQTLKKAKQQLVDVIGVAKDAAYAQLAAKEKAFLKANEGHDQAKIQKASKERTAAYDEHAALSNMVPKEEREEIPPPPPMDMEEDEIPGPPEEVANQEAVIKQEAPRQEVPIAPPRTPDFYQSRKDVTDARKLADSVQKAYLSVQADYNRHDDARETWKGKKEQTRWSEIRDKKGEFLQSYAIKVEAIQDNAKKLQDVHDAKYGKPDQGGFDKNAPEARVKPLSDMEDKVAKLRGILAENVAKRDAKKERVEALIKEREDFSRAHGRDPSVKEPVIKVEEDNKFAGKRAKPTGDLAKALEKGTEEVPKQKTHADIAREFGGGNAIIQATARIDEIQKELDKLTEKKMSFGNKVLFHLETALTASVNAFSHYVLFEKKSKATPLPTREAYIEAEFDKKHGQTGSKKAAKINDQRDELQAQFNKAQERLASLKGQGTHADDPDEGWDVKAGPPLVSAHKKHKDTQEKLSDKPKKEPKEEPGLKRQHQTFKK